MKLTDLVEDENKNYLCPVCGVVVVSNQEFRVCASPGRAQELLTRAEAHVRGHKHAEDQYRLGFAAGFQHAIDHLLKHLPTAKAAAKT